MDEADGIILQSLQDIGWYSCIVYVRLLNHYTLSHYVYVLIFSDIDEQIKCLADLTTELVIESVVKCILAVQPSLQTTLTSRLPINLPARYKLCMDISNTCKVSANMIDCFSQTFVTTNKLIH